MFVVIALAGACRSSEAPKPDPVDDLATRVGREIDDAIAMGQLDRAEARFREHAGAFDEQRRQDLAFALGAALFNPGGRYDPPPGATWRSILTSRRKRPTEQDCTSQGHVRPVRQRELVRSHAYYLQAKRLNAALDVAFRARDLSRYEEDLARAGKVPADRFRERAQLLLAAGRLAEARTFAETAAQTVVEGRECSIDAGAVKCTSAAPPGARPRCDLWLLVGAIHERERTYAAARRAYETAKTASGDGRGCARTAEARALALAKARDGEALPAARVTGGVVAPPEAKVAVRLVADLAETMNPLGVSPHDLWDTDPASLDYTGHLAVLVPERDGNDFAFERVPPGAWNVVLVVDGPQAYAPVGCWKHAIVDQREVSVGTLTVAADPSQGPRKP